MGLYAPIASQVYRVHLRPATNTGRVSVAKVCNGIKAIQDADHLDFTSARAPIAAMDIGLVPNKKRSNSRKGNSCHPFFTRYPRVNEHREFFLV